MLKKLFNMIREAISHMNAYKDIAHLVKVEDTINSKMENKLRQWRDMYKDQMQTMNVAKSACEVMTMTMLNEMTVNIDNDIMQANIDKHLLADFDQKIEKALAVGGCIFKPYVKNGVIYFDVCYQGEFYPISFNDDGDLVDVAFVDQFVRGSQIYTLVERQTFNNNSVVIENKAFRGRYQETKENVYTELGIEIELSEVDKWADITPVIRIDNVIAPLFGYFKVASTNNIDMKNPLGVSFFANSYNMIKLINKQIDRLDWEYEGGELAIDVDPTALRFKETYLGREKYLPHNQERIFRQVDIGSDETYKPYNPTLRDGSYLEGLNRYLVIVEDQLGLARGSLSRGEEMGRTATEIRILKQRAYTTAEKNQHNLKKALEQLIYSAVVYANYFNVEYLPNYELVIDFGDSVLVDKDSEVPLRLQLVNNNVISKAELRSWYTGEDLEMAEQNIQEILDKNKINFGNDLFGSTD